MSGRCLSDSATIKHFRADARTRKRDQLTGEHQAMTRSSGVVKLWVASRPGVAETTRGGHQGVSLMQPQYTLAKIVRFWSKVDRNGPVPEHCADIGPCWVWTGWRATGGYGRVSIDKVRWLAHRVAYSLERGPIPIGLGCLHRCDNRLCVRPSHLFLGTAMDNVRDMIAKGRTNWATGDRNASRKYPERRPRGRDNQRTRLTVETVLEIKQRLAGGVKCWRIGRDLGIPASTVRSIHVGQTWRSVEAV